MFLISHMILYLLSDIIGGGYDSDYLVGESFI